MADMTTSNGGYANGYGKRPLWQWILLYVIIGGLIYAAVYYFYLNKKGGYTTVTYPSADKQVAASASPEAMLPETTPVSSLSPTTAPTTAALIQTSTLPGHSAFLTDSEGMTLYVFDEDTKGVSNCNGGCATAWPPYKEIAGAKLPANLTVLKRADGSAQYAYKGLPVYYYFKDNAAGDITGDGVDGTWHLVKP